MKAVVFFSGGLMSWAAAKRAVQKYGAENTTLLFTDTLIEDPDLYRFLAEAAANVGAALVRIADGRTPWETFRDAKTIGNTRRDPCSKLLKRVPARKWLAENCEPAETVLIFGIGWEESHRFDGEPRGDDGLRSGVKNVYQRLGWPHVEAPMLDSPWMTPQDVRQWARLEGLKVPRLYDLGFAHNNCGGFCVKAGEGHFVNLLRKLPEVYAHHEAQEEAFNAARPGKARQTVLAPERPTGERDEKGRVVRKRTPMSCASSERRTRPACSSTCSMWAVAAVFWRTRHDRRAEGRNDPRWAPVPLRGVRRRGRLGLRLPGWSSDNHEAGRRARRSHEQGRKHERPTHD